MKFWELVSVFQRNQKQLEKVLNSNKWKFPFGEWISDYDTMINDQDRKKLDCEMPALLVLDVAKYAGDSLIFYLDKNADYLRSSRHSVSDIELNSLEAARNFGGSALHETLEKGVMDVSKYKFLELFHTLMTPINGMRGYTRIILAENNVCNNMPTNMPTEIIDWLEKYSPTFDDWDKKLGTLRVSTRNLSAAQLCQRLIDALEGLEAVINEGNSLSKKFALEGIEKKLFDGIIDTLPHIYEHYKRLQSDKVLTV